MKFCLIFLAGALCVLKCSAGGVREPLSACPDERGSFELWRKSPMECSVCYCFGARHAVCERCQDVWVPVGGFKVEDMSKDYPHCCPVVIAPRLQSELDLTRLLTKIPAGGNSNRKQ